MLTTWDKQKNPPMPTSYSAESTGELLTFLENNVGSTCFIAAGYEDRMQDDFLRANPGLTRRFTQFIYIQDYKPDELERIFLDDLARKMSGDGAEYQRADVRKWFTKGALQYLRVLLAAREEVYPVREMVKDDEGIEHEVETCTGSTPHLHEMFNAQAGAHGDAGVRGEAAARGVGQGRQSDGRGQRHRTFAMGPEDVKKIIESRFLKKSKDAGGGRRGAGQARVQARLAARGHVVAGVPRAAVEARMRRRPRPRGRGRGRGRGRPDAQQAQGVAARPPRAKEPGRAGDGVNY